MKKQTAPATPEIKVELPFEGYYESSLSYSMDNEEAFLSDSEEVPHEDLEFTWDLKKLTEAYCSILVDYIKEYTGLEFDYKDVSLYQPQYYNYDHDRLYADLSYEHAQALKAYVRENYPNELKQVLEDTTTPCSGYIPYYTFEQAFEQAFTPQAPECLAENYFNALFAGIENKGYPSPSAYVLNNLECLYLYVDYKKEEVQK